MDEALLFKYGFSINCGAIDRNNTYYGRLTVNGPELSEEGRELLNRLMAEDAVTVEPAPEVAVSEIPQPPKRRGRPPGTRVGSRADVPAEVVE